MMPKTATVSGYAASMRYPLKVCRQLLLALQEYQ